MSELNEGQSRTIAALRERIRELSAVEAYAEQLAKAVEDECEWLAQRREDAVAADFNGLACRYDERRCELAAALAKNPSPSAPQQASGSGPVPVSVEEAGSRAVETKQDSCAQGPDNDRRGAPNLAQGPNATKSVEPLTEELHRALVVVLPMAKGYAHEHPVGDNEGKVKWAQEIAEKFAAPVVVPRVVPLPPEGK